MLITGNNLVPSKKINMDPDIAPTMMNTSATSGILVVGIADIGIPCEADNSSGTEYPAT